MQIQQQMCVSQFLQKLYGQQPTQRCMKAVVEGKVCRLQFATGVAVPKQFKRELTAFSQSVAEQGLFEAVAIQRSLKSKRSFATLCPDNWLSGPFRANISINEKGMLEIVKWVRPQREDNHAKLLEVTNKYMGFIQEFSGLGPKPTYAHPPEEAIAEDCKRIFNGKLCETSRAAFIDLLTNFYKANGSWSVVVDETIVSTRSSVVTSKLRVNIKGKEFTEIVLLRFNDKLRISTIEALLVPVGNEIA